MSQTRNAPGKPAKIADLILGFGGKGAHKENSGHDAKASQEAHEDLAVAADLHRAVHAHDMHGIAAALKAHHDIHMARHKNKELEIQEHEESTDG